MAAPSGIVWGSTVNSKGKIGIYVTTSSTETGTNVSIQTWFWSRYSCTDSNNDYYFDNNATSATTNRGSKTIKTTVNSSWSKSNQVKLGEASYSYARASTKKTIYCAVKLTGVDWVNGTMKCSTSYSIPALKSYAVTYNANGGAGEPGTQTKYYGKDLQLSSTVPTRTGHRFETWGNSATSWTATYQPGETYKTNAALALYAIWAPYAYTVSYSANGGSGAPESQTKIYGVNLTLSSTTPTRTNYIFKGWGTSATTTTVSYAAGATYTANSGIVLYAIWELVYTEPKISSFNVTRCLEDGTPDDFGTYIKVSFAWSCDNKSGTNSVSAISIAYKTPADLDWTYVAVTASGTSGSVSQIFGDGQISIENSYSITVSVTDTMGGSTQSTGVVGSASFPIDFLAGGKGAAVGRVSTKENAFCLGWDMYDRFDTLIGNGLAAYNNSSQIDPNTTLESLCLTNKNVPMSGNYMYVHTVFFNTTTYPKLTKSTSSYRAQYAIPYNVNGSMYHRYYNGTAWSSWRRHVNEDEFNGTFTFGGAEPTRTRIYPNGSNGGAITIDSSAGASNQGIVIRGDTEGGNICIFSPKSNGRNVRYWELDAYDGGFRIYAADNSNAFAGAYRFYAGPGGNVMASPSYENPRMTCGRATITVSSVATYNVNVNTGLTYCNAMIVTPYSKSPSHRGLCTAYPTSNSNMNIYLYNSSALSSPTGIGIFWIAFGY